MVIIFKFFYYVNLFFSALSMVMAILNYQNAQLLFSNILSSIFFLVIALIQSFALSLHLKKIKLLTLIKYVNQQRSGVRNIPLHELKEIIQIIFIADLQMIKDQKEPILDMKWVIIGNRGTNILSERVINDYSKLSSAKEIDLSREEQQYLDSVLTEVKNATNIEEVVSKRFPELMKMYLFSGK